MEGPFPALFDVSYNSKVHCEFVTERWDFYIELIFYDLLIPSELIQGNNIIVSTAHYLKESIYVALIQSTWPESLRNSHTIIGYINR